MAVKVRCQECEKVLNVPDAARGKSVKCPGCNAKVSVPGEKTSAKPAAKPKAKAKAGDSEHSLKTLDLRNAEDFDARICPKCGYDMGHLDEESTECPKCGTDIETGGLGEKARKKALKGPDPDKFFETMWGGQWKFVFKHQSLAWRTVLYVWLASMLMFTMLWCFYRIPQWPPRIFFALMTVVCAMMIPGWLWFLDGEIVKGTLERKEKLKRINMDFFLCSALGVKWLLWHICVGLPVLIIPCGLAWFLVSMNGMPMFVGAIIVAVGYLPLIPLMGVAMGHMVMPQPEPGFMIWKLIPGVLKSFKACFLWSFLVVMLHLPAIGCIAAAGALYGEQLSTLSANMVENGAIYRAKYAAENASKAYKEKLMADPRVTKEYLPTDYWLTLVPLVLWSVGCLTIGYTAVYCMRLNGQLIYFFREHYDLQALVREYKYVAKEQEDEDADVKPKTFGQVCVDALVINVILLVVGVAGGVVYGSLNSDLGMFGGMAWGLILGPCFAGGVARLMIIGAGFQESPLWGLIVWFVPFGELIFLVKFWEQGRPAFMTGVFAAAFMMVIFPIIIISGIFAKGGAAQQQDAPPAAIAPADAGGMPADPGMMPAGNPVP